MIRSGVDGIKSMGLATMSGMVEPLGAFMSVFAIQSLGGGAAVVGWSLGFTAEVMTYMTIDELMPVAHEHCAMNYKRIVSSGLLTGMVFAQVLSLILPI